MIGLAVAHSIAIASLLSQATPALAQAGSCDDEEFLRECPSACVESCESDAFFDAHPEACTDIQVRPIDPATEPDRCSVATVAPSADSDKLASCLANAKRGPTIQERVERLSQTFPDEFKKDIQSVVADFPTSCVPNIPAVVGMYSCLSGEGEQIGKEFLGLQEKGYVSVTEVDRACKLSEEDIAADVLLSQMLEKRSTRLLAEFETARGCRREIEGWLEKKSAIPATSPNSGQLMQNTITQFQNQLAPSAETEVEIEGMLRKIKPNIDSIKAIIVHVMITCPPTVIESENTTQGEEQ